jgi:hypothetical protein
MTRRFFRGLFSIILVGALFMGLTSCRGGQADLPSAVIDQAVTMQAQANQTSLWQKLALPSDEGPELSISRIKVDRIRSVTVAAEPAYEVVGTYQSKIRYPHRRAIKQSQVPFDVVLQTDASTGNWRVLQAESEVKGDRPWRWQLLQKQPT